MGAFLSNLWSFLWSWKWNKKQKQKRVSQQKQNNPAQRIISPSLNIIQQKPMAQQNQINLSRNNQTSSINIRQIRLIQSKQLPRDQRNRSVQASARLIKNKTQNKPSQKDRALQNLAKNRNYQLTNQDAKILSKIGFVEGDERYSVEDCRREMKKQLQMLNTQYKYRFKFNQQTQEIYRGKKMTRTIYLVFQCNNCPENKWTSIGGTFQISFQYYKQRSQLVYYLQIFKTQCRQCMNYMIPKTYKTQMDAMKIFFSSLITNIIENKPPPQKPQKYYIKENHWHKKQWCQACQLGRCTTQNRK